MLISVYEGIMSDISMSSFQGVGIEGVPLYIELSPLEVSPFQGVGIELYIEVSSFQGVGIEEFHCIQRCPRFSGLE